LENTLDTEATSLEPLFERNKEWSDKIRKEDPGFFDRLASIQNPEYLWIGCSDSRVPANQITGLQPGEVFVHRNIANVVVHSDLNCLSVLQYAVDALRVKHILVVGHYGCGGVRAALNNLRLGLVDNWLRHIRDVRQKHIELLDQLPDNPSKLNALCELNVIEQVMNVCHTTVAREAWDRGQNLTVHGWIYGLSDGIVRDLNMSISAHDQAHQSYCSAIEQLQSSLS
jgi:carbonic anhydrase